MTTPLFFLVHNPPTLFFALFFTPHTPQTPLVTTITLAHPHSHSHSTPIALALSSLPHSSHLFRISRCGRNNNEHHRNQPQHSPIWTPSTYLKYAPHGLLSVETVKWATQDEPLDSP
ncbi:MAG: hypothetical protein J3Q66DRAFT_374871 [Benniella sp.]|nr:MAG: hypothetical protein J3Q66DRAFT_374871 [Benniella sp.]